MSRAILHMDLDSFYVSVERLLDSRLIGRPILLGGTSDRGVVASCSYETRYYGVHSGMPMRMARELCPDAVIIRGNSSTYSKYSQVVTEIMKEDVPVLEKSSIDEFYADLTGMDRFFGCFKFAKELRSRVIKETGLPISFGLSVNKTVAKIATGEAKPNNKIRIDNGGEKQFLAPLSIRKIPMVGSKTYRMLRDLGVQHIQTVQEMPMTMMQRVLGLNGQEIWKRANGIDHRPLVPYTERKSISTERTFDKDTIDVKRLRSIIMAMEENLAFQLRRGKKLTACVTVKIRYSDFNTYSKQRRLRSYTALDHTLLETSLDLFDKLYDKRLLVRLIGVRFSHLIEGSYQMDLFNDDMRTIRLYKAMDRVRDRYGERSLYRANTKDVKTIGRFFNPFNGEPPLVLAHRKQ